MHQAGNAGGEHLKTTKDTLILYIHEKDGSPDEAALRERGRIGTAFGETLSWEYLSYVRSHPTRWDVPTRVLYGAADDLTDRGTVTAFCKRYGAELTVMEKGEHWFHTPEQMAFLDDWLRQDA